MLSKSNKSYCNKKSRKKPQVVNVFPHLKDISVLKTEIFAQSDLLALEKNKLKQRDGRFTASLNSSIDAIEFTAFILQKRLELADSITVSSSLFADKHNAIKNRINSLRNELRRKISINELENPRLLTDRIDSFENKSTTRNLEDRLSLDNTYTPVIRSKTAERTKKSKKVVVNYNKTYFLTRDYRQRQMVEKDDKEKEQVKVTSNYEHVKSRHMETRFTGSPKEEEPEELSYFKYTSKTWTKDPEPPKYKSRFFN